MKQRVIKVYRVTEVATLDITDLGNNAVVINDALKDAKKKAAAGELEFIPIEKSDIMERPNPEFLAVTIVDESDNPTTRPAPGAA